MSKIQFRIDYVNFHTEWSEISEGLAISLAKDFGDSKGKLMDKLKKYPVVIYHNQAADPPFGCMYKLRMV